MIVPLTLFATGGGGGGGGGAVLQPASKARADSAEMGRKRMVNLQKIGGRRLAPS
jgi:hypothetical protein